MTAGGSWRRTADTPPRFPPGASKSQDAFVLQVHGEGEGACTLLWCVVLQRPTFVRRSRRSRGVHTYMPLHTRVEEAVTNISCSHPSTWSIFIYIAPMQPSSAHSCCFPSALDSGLPRVPSSSPSYLWLTFSHFHFSSLLPHHSWALPGWCDWDKLESLVPQNHLSLSLE